MIGAVAEFNSTERFTGIVLAAGRGERLAEPTAARPKQFRSLFDGQSTEICAASLSLLKLASCCGALRLVIPPDWSGAQVEQLLPRTLRLIRTVSSLSIVNGGCSRAESVQRACEGLTETDYLLIHDAARPAVSLADLQRLCQVVEQTHELSGALLAMPVTDTLKRADALATVQATIDRGQLWAAQTPQLVKTNEFVCQLAAEPNTAVTDDVSWLEQQGAVQLVAAADPNPKLTYGADLTLLQAYLPTQLNSLSTTQTLIGRWLRELSWSTS